MSKKARRSRSSVLWPYETCMSARSHDGRAMAKATHESMPPLSRTAARWVSPGFRSMAGVRVSDAAHVGGPDVLVDLELQTDRQAIGQDPFRQPARLEDAVHGRQQHAAPVGETMTRDDLPGPVVIGPVAHDEFHLVRRLQEIDVLEAVLPLHAASRALPGPDHHGARVEWRKIQAAAGFDGDFEAAIAELTDQVVHAFLQEGLAPRDQDVARPERGDARQDRADRQVAPFLEGVRRIAPRAAQIAVGEADEHARSTRVPGFPLDGVEDLVDRHDRGLPIASQGRDIHGRLPALAARALRA